MVSLSKNGNQLWNVKEMVLIEGLSEIVVKVNINNTKVSSGNTKTNVYCNFLDVFRTNKKPRTSPGHRDRFLLRM